MEVRRIHISADCPTNHSRTSRIALFLTLAMQEKTVRTILTPIADYEAAIMKLQRLKGFDSSTGCKQMPVVPYTEQDDERFSEMWTATDTGSRISSDWCSSSS